MTIELKDLVSVALILIGLLACFAGTRFFRTVLTLFGVVGGGLAGALLLRDSGETIMLAGAVIGAILGGVLFNLLFSFAMTLIGVVLGITLGLFIISTAGTTDPVVNVIIVAVLAFIGAILASRFERLIIALATAFIGAVMITEGALLFIPGVGSMDEATRLPVIQPTGTWAAVAIAAVIVLTLLGFTAQMRLRRR
jgi:hypothetical protein